MLHYIHYDIKSMYEVDRTYQLQYEGTTVCSGLSGPQSYKYICVSGDTTTRANDLQHVGT